MSRLASRTYMALAGNTPVRHHSKLVTIILTAADLAVSKWVRKKTAGWRRSSAYPTFLILADSYIATPLKTKHLYNICAMLVQRRRRRAVFVQMLYKCFVFVGISGVDVGFANTIRWINVALTFGPNIDSTYTLSYPRGRYNSHF